MNVPSYWPSRHWISFAFCPLTCHVTHSPVYLAGGATHASITDRSKRGANEFAFLPKSYSFAKVSQAQPNRPIVVEPIVTPSARLQSTSVLPMRSAGEKLGSRILRASSNGIPPLS